MKTLEIVEKLFCEQKKLLLYSWEGFCSEPLAALLEKLRFFRGTLFFTGVGKSAFVAQKGVQSLLSCGIEARYLCPTDALHGDIGIVKRGDWVLFLSKSGESEELLEMAPFLKERGAHMAAFVSFEKCRLAKWVDILVPFSLLRELGPLPLPTTSTVLQLFYIDLFVVALLTLKEISLEEFMRNHPSGQIGKRLLAKVDDFMREGEQIPIAKASDLVAHTLIELSAKRCGCILVVDQENLLGIFTDGDLRRCLQKHGVFSLQKRVEQVMTGSPRTIEQGALAYEALQLMESNPQQRISTLPVMQKGILKGIVSLHDLLQAGL